jgi:signal transduction histidine kinase
MDHPPARTWRRTDVLAPAALVAVLVADLSTNAAAWPTPMPAVAALLLGACLALVARRTWPAASTVAAAALVAGYLLVLHDDLTQQPAIEPFLILLVAFFALGLHASRTELLVGGLCSGTLIGTAELLALDAGRPFGDVAPPLLFWSVAVVLGRLLHHRHREVEGHRERAVRAELERDERVREASAAERIRIARELHDVVAHSLSVIVIQASVEARLLVDQAGSTGQTLRTIEQTGRSALDELRRLLGLLRSDTDELADSMQPLPSLEQVGRLLDQLRGAGLDVSLEVSGTPRTLPTGMELSAYRITQEALTNALKHAPGAAVRVRIGYTDDGLTVEVADDGRRPDRPPLDAGSGNGLTGIRERVRLYAGRLEAGPREGGGFTVRAVLPIGEAR